MNVIARLRSIVLMSAAALALTAAPAQAGWGATQIVDERRGYEQSLEVVSSARGHTVAAWRSGRGVRVAVARPGGRMGRSRYVRGSEDAFGVRLAVAPDGRALLGLGYHDETEPGGLEDRFGGCCEGTKVAVVSASGRPTTARVVTTPGSTTRLAALAATRRRFGVLVDARGQSSVSFVPVSRSGRPARPRVVARGPASGAALQFRGRRAVAAVLGERPGEVEVWTQRADGRFGALPTRVRLPGLPERRSYAEPLVTADGRGGHVVVYGWMEFISTRVLVTQLTPGGRAVVLAGPFPPANDVHLEPAAIAGRDLAVAWLEGGAPQRVRLIQRRGSGTVVRRTLTPPGRLLYELNVALGGGRVALAGTEGGFRGNSPPSALILGGRRTTRLKLARASGTVSAPAVVVDPRGVARFLWRDRVGRVLMRVHRP